MTGIIIITTITSIVLIGTTLYLLMQKRYEKAIIDYQNKLLSKEMDEVKNIYKTMRGWRHDYHNHMQSVKAYLANDSLAEARLYIDRLETELDDISSER